MIASTLTTLFLVAAIISALIQIISFGIFLRFLVKDKPRPKSTGPFPGVTVLKACYLIDDGEEINFDRFFRQDYPGPFQLLFVASRETDPAVALVRNLIAKYPHVDAQLLISTTRKAYYGKIDAVYDGHQNAKYDFLITTDSDTRVKLDYVRLMVAALQEPGISLVASPQMDFGANTFGSAFKCLGNNTDVSTLLFGYIKLAGDNVVVFGHSMAFRLSEFRSLPGDNWEFLNSFLAEDMAYGHLFRRAGRRVVFRNVYCPVIYAGKTFKQAHEQKVRWLINQKSCCPNRVVFLSVLFAYPQVNALFCLLASGFSSLGWAVFFGVLPVRILLSTATEWLCFRSLRPNLKYFWVIPVWDLFQIYFGIWGFFKTQINYGSKTYRVVNRYFLEEIPSGS